jgi:hypothetical protein
MAKYPGTINFAQSVLIVHPLVEEGFTQSRYYGPFDAMQDAHDFATTVLCLNTGYTVTPLIGVQCDEYGHWMNPRSPETPDTAS